MRTDGAVSARNRDTERRMAAMTNDERWGKRLRAKELMVDLQNKRLTYKSDGQVQFGATRCVESVAENLIGF